MNAVTKHLTLTSRIRARLDRQIFNGPSEDIYGEETNHLEREERFGNVRSTIVHLLHNEHYPTDVRLSELLNDLRQKSDQMLALPEAEKYFGAKRHALLGSLMTKIIQGAKARINPSFEVDEIRRFVELAIVGRTLYREEGYDPDEFITAQFVMFASMITDNFEAYKATLNHQYVK